MQHMDKKSGVEPKQDRLVLELRRGILVLATLSQLDEAKYGYSLMQELANQGLEIEQGTLYPLLRRLEDKGLLASQWNVEGSRPRRYYQLSPAGAEVLDSLSYEWNELVAVMDDLLSPSKNEGYDESHRPVCRRSRKTLTSQAASRRQDGAALIAGRYLGWQG